jgi:peptide deformylase
MEVEAPRIVQVGDPVLRSAATAVDVDAIGRAEMRDLIAGMVAAMREGAGYRPCRTAGRRLEADLRDGRQAGNDRGPAEGRIAGKRARAVAAARADQSGRAAGRSRDARLLRRAASASRAIRRWSRAIARSRSLISTRTGEPQEWIARGWPARVVQHEYDHLEAVLYTDKMIARSFMSNDEFRARYAAGRSPR